MKTIPIRTIAALLTLVPGLASMSVAADLPYGVKPSNHTVEAVFVRGVKTTPGGMLETSRFKAEDAMCQQYAHRPARILNGSLEDVHEMPFRAFIQKDRLAEYSEQRFLKAVKTIRTPQGLNVRCDFEIQVRHRTTIRTITSGKVETVEFDPRTRRGTRNQRTKEPSAYILLASDTFPKGVRLEPLGRTSTVAGYTCQEHALDLGELKFEACLVDDPRLPAWLQNTLLRHKNYSEKTTVWETTVQFLDPAARIDAAVFHIPGDLTLKDAK